MVGYRQIFVRFQGCNLACRYCDSPARRLSGEPARIEGPDGRSEIVPNPISPGELARLILRLASPRPHSVSLTGGEPLLDPEYLLNLLPLLKVAGLAVYLETNGTRPEAMRRVASFIDFIAMDIKLPSVAGTPVLFNLHRRFLRAAGHSRTFAKVVLDGDYSPQELRKAADMAREAGIPLILQPVTRGDGTLALGPDDLLAAEALVRAVHDDVRVIPQTHIFLGIP